MEVYQFMQEHLDTYLASCPAKTEMAYFAREAQNLFQEHKAEFELLLPRSKRKLLNNYLRQMRFGFRQATRYYFSLGIMNAVRFGKEIPKDAMKDSWEYHIQHPRFTRTEKDKREYELSKKYTKYFEDSLHRPFCVVSSDQQLYMFITCYNYYMAGIEWAQKLFKYADIEPHPAPPEPYPKAADAGKQ